MSDAAKTAPPLATASAALPALPEIKVVLDDEGVVFPFGDEEVKVPPLSFYITKRVWEDMTSATVENDPIKRIDRIINICAITLRESGVEGAERYTNEYFERKLKARQWPHITASYIALLRLSGLLPDEPPPLEAPGELQGGEAKFSASSNLSSNASGNGASQQEVTSSLLADPPQESPTSIQ